MFGDYKGVKTKQTNKRILSKVQYVRTVLMVPFLHRKSHGETSLIRYSQAFTSTRNLI